MEWRCEWCGKPHEENDPPCDECGHGEFEEAVVRVETGTVETGTTYVWSCEECGRNHPKHSPPCSRCGHMHLEKQEQAFDESELQAASYLDMGKEYIAASVALVVVVALVAAGVIPVPGLGGDDLSDVPGEAELSNGHNLSVAESEITARINEHRAEEDLSPLRTDRDLDAVAERHNKLLVAERYGDRESESLRESYQQVGYECSRDPVREVGVVPVREEESPLQSYDDESEFATAVSWEFTRGDGRGEGLFGPDRETVGVDVHVAPDGAVFVTVTAC
jgi:uncharacterized Zn finger protein